ncbi:iron-siderophore ABC transporter substrate-binding protein [Pseudonocardia sp.]|uniref:iron-siderophore ABC transporter substrate-binding protein n=1 Tax=Pseudonocardia sp. TaxID=60912 RepID=UPI00260163D9|nr:iron-siderophore ABC transporter substrate-binding protein [Pseudonocardia sp.]
MITIDRPSAPVVGRGAVRDRPLPPIDDATRRELLAGAALLLATAACGTGGPAPAPAAGPRTIEHAFGSTRVPAAPERVVTLGYVDQDAVLALGVTPVAVRQWVGDQPPADWPWQRDLVAGTAPAALPFELDLEQLAALEPDLILAVWAGITESEYADLSRIAPTVPHESAHAADPFLAPWQDRTRHTGRILGRAERADELVAEVEDRFAQVRARRPEFAGATLAIVEGPVEGDVFVFTPANLRGYVAEALGFTVPAQLTGADPGTGIIELSQEQLDRVDLDVVLWIGEDRDAIRAMPLHARLDAVREGREVFADPPVITALSFGTVLSLPYALDRLEPALAAAIDGDPVTAVPA